MFLQLSQIYQRLFQMSLLQLQSLLPQLLYSKLYSQSLTPQLPFLMLSSQNPLPLSQSLPPLWLKPPHYLPQ